MLEGDVPGKVLAGHFKGFCLNNFHHFVWPADFCFLFTSPSANLCRERRNQMSQVAPGMMGGAGFSFLSFLFFSLLKIRRCVPFIYFRKCEPIIFSIIASPILFSPSSGAQIHIIFSFFPLCPLIFPYDLSLNFLITLSKHTIVL